jgi:hypothetical protein
MLRLVALASLFSLSLLSACCGGKSTPPTTPEPTPGTSEPGPTEPGTEPGTEPVIDVAQLGSECGEGDRCASGLTCVKYYGIAGPSGPEFKSCEVTCAEKTTCPTGSSCVTIADGPGAVCRAAEPVVPAAGAQ